MTRCVFFDALRVIESLVCQGLPTEAAGGSNFMQSLRCKIGFHDWSEWEDSVLNRYSWFKNKNKVRFCRRCQADQRVFFSEVDKNENVGKIGEDEDNKNKEMNQLGRKLNVKMVKKAKKYRNKGLSYRDIAKLLNRDVKQIHRWVNYPHNELLRKC